MKLRSFLESAAKSAAKYYNSWNDPHYPLWHKKTSSSSLSETQIKTSRHLCILLLGGGVFIREFFLLLFAVRKKKIKILQLILCNWKKKMGLSTVCYQSAPPEFPKIITTARQPAPKSLDNKGSQPAM